MTTTTHAETAAEITLRIRQNDREEAHENACDAYHAIEALQRTDTWLDLPLTLRRQLSASHALLGGLADAISEAL
jgi:hypothetical protein